MASSLKDRKKYRKRKTENLIMFNLTGVSFPKRASKQILHKDSRSISNGHWLIVHLLMNLHFCNVGTNVEIQRCNKKWRPVIVTMFNVIIRLIFSIFQWYSQILQSATKKSFGWCNHQLQSDKFWNNFHYKIIIFTISSRFTSCYQLNQSDHIKRHSTVIE